VPAAPTALGLLRILAEGQRTLRLISSLAYFMPFIGRLTDNKKAPG
jgi:hypothetical protein